MKISVLNLHDENLSPFAINGWRNGSDIGHAAHEMVHLCYVAPNVEQGEKKQLPGRHMGFRNETLGSKSQVEMAEAPDPPGLAENLDQ